MGGDAYKYNKAVYLWFDYDKAQARTLPFFALLACFDLSFASMLFFKSKRSYTMTAFSHCWFRNLCRDTYTDIQWVDVIFYTGRPVLRLTYSCYVCKIKLNVTTWVHLLMQFMWPREADLLTIW